MFDGQSLHHAVFFGTMTLLGAVTLGFSIIYAFFLGTIVTAAWALVVIRPVPMQNSPTVKASQVEWAVLCHLCAEVLARALV